MNRFMRWALCPFVVAALIMLCGCGQVSEKRNTIETTREYVPAEYKTTQVRRGDVKLTETVRLSYFAAKQETLAFPISGLYYDSVDAGVGDEVKAGDVLARLECTELDAKIADLEAQKAALEIEINRQTELIELLENRGGAEAQKRACEITVRSAEADIAVIDAQLEEELESRSQRVLIAGMDGTVTYAREVAPGETSTINRPIIVITDLDMCAFSASVTTPEALDPEKIYTVTVDGTDYDLQLTTAAELGLEDTKNAKSTRTNVYFRTLTPSVNLNEDSSARFTVVVDSREDTLCLPAKALATINGESCVYVPDENGFCSIRPVKVGLITMQTVEILEGLDEGETVIVF